MYSTRVSPLVLAQLLFIAGCTQPAWEKQNAEPAALKQDLEQCEQLARAQTSSPSSNIATTREITVVGAAAIVSVVPDQSERQAREREVTNSCMQQKGYRPPAKPGGMR